MFTERGAWEQFAGQNEATVLLVSQPLYERYAEENGRPGRRIILSEGRDGPPGEQWIDKYQSVEAVVRKVLELASDAGLLPPAARAGGAGGNEADRRLFTGGTVSSNHIFFYSWAASCPETQGALSEF